MNKDGCNGYKFNEFGTIILVEALSNCSKSTQEEVGEELEKIRENLL